MIQRVQTLFLLLAGASFITLFYAPFATSDVSSGVLLADTRYTVEDHLLLGGLCLFGAVLSVVAIFLYKNRSLQMRLGRFVIVAAILLVIASLLVFVQDAPQQSDGMEVSEGPGLIVPIVAVIMAALALRFIRKDENLVKSMDRLR